MPDISEIIFASNW